MTRSTVCALLAVASIFGGIGTVAWWRCTKAWPARQPPGASETVSRTQLEDEFAMTRQGSPAADSVDNLLHVQYLQGQWCRQHPEIKQCPVSLPPFAALGHISGSSR